MNLDTNQQGQSSKLSGMALWWVERNWPSCVSSEMQRVREEFDRSPVVCESEKNEYVRFISYSDADVVVMSGGSGESAVATAFMIGKMCASDRNNERIKRLNKFIVVAKDLPHAMRMKQVLSEVFKGTKISIYDPPLQPVTDASSENEGLIVLEETALEILVSGYVGCYIMDDSDSCRQSPTLIKFLESAKKEREPVFIDGVEYTVKNPRMGKLIVMTNNDKATLDYWKNETLRLRSEGLAVAHHICTTNDPPNWSMRLVVAHMLPDKLSTPAGMWSQSPSIRKTTAKINTECREQGVNTEPMSDLCIEDKAEEKPFDVEEWVRSSDEQVRE